MKKIYIIKQKWFTPTEGLNIDIYAAYETLEKAQKALEEIHDEDIEWVTCHGFNNFNCNELTTKISYVANNEFWSYNEIIERELK